MIKFDKFALYTIEEATKIMSLSYHTIRKYILNGELEGRKVGTKWYVTEESIKAYLSSVVSSNTGDEVKQ